MNRICEQVRDLLAHDRGNLNFSPASRYAVQKLIDYAEQEHELRSKAEERCAKMDSQVADAFHMVKAQERTIDDLRQQLSLMQQAQRQARWHAGCVNMDVAEFFSEFRRMCKSSSDCAKCEYHGDRCNNAIELLEKTVAVVEQWSKEHPRKTRQDVFLEQWPNCLMDDYGVAGVRPRNIDKMYVCNLSRSGGCTDCRREFWTQEVE